MKAVILAAGKGINIKSRGEVPGCMIKMGGTTLLEYNFSQLPSKIKEVVVVVGHLKSKIKKHLGKNMNGKPVRFVEQKERLGTGHALSVCKDVLKGSKFVVLMGDNLYLKKDIEKCLHNNLAVMVKKMEASESFGFVEERNGFLSDARERRRQPAGTFIDCGLYVLDERIFHFPMVQTENGDYRLLKQIVEMSKRYPVKVEKASLWMSTGTIQDIKKAGNFVKNISG